MILRFTGDVEKARQMMRWLHDNVASASKPDLTPSYASFLNGTVRWDSLEMREGITWYVSCRVRSNEIEVQLPNDQQLAFHFSLLWTG
jgi:hypothetical protein